MTQQFINAKRFFNEIKKTVYLYKNLWKECTTALLHAPRNVDKTATALIIANDIAKTGREVLYVNANNLDSQAKVDADSLYIFTPEFESIDDNRDYADIVFEAIEEAVRTTSIRTFVIDSVTRIAALSFGRNASAAYIMKRLVALQVKCKLSILVVADDTTKSVNNSLLALADSEINLTDKPEISDNSEHSEVSGHSDIPQAPLCFKTTMSRQQRRALERQQLKNNKSPLVPSKCEGHTQIHKLFPYK